MNDQRGPRKGSAQATRQRRASGPPSAPASRSAAAPPRLQGLRRLRGYSFLLRGQSRDLALVFLLMVASSGVSLVIPLYAGRFVDALGHGLAEGATPLLGMLALLLGAQFVATYFYSVTSARLGLRSVTILRRRLFAHLLELPSLELARQQAGDLSSRMTGDVGSIRYILTSGLVAFARAIITLLGALALMFHLNARLTVVVLVLVPATILLVQLFGHRLHRLSRQMFVELGQISNHVQEIMGAIPVIKVYNTQAHERQRFTGMLDRYYRAGLNRAWLQAALESAMQILLWVCLIAVVVYGFSLASHGQTTFGHLVTFLLLVYRVAVPMSSLTSLYASAQGAVAAAERLDELFDLPPERTPARPAIARPRPRLACQGMVAFQEVHFAYDGQPVLSDLSLEISAGEWVGLVGPSGAGKTTLIGLIMRLFDPQQGRLLLDGRPYPDYDVADLRAQMAFVSQDPVLYNTSVEENIRFGLNEASTAQVHEAAAQAGALEFIENLPDGFATGCGERGMRLSGGERQRITLARAFLRNPRILILDEPTSALDAETEEAVRRSFIDLMRGRTAIVIAHRLSLVRDLDRILVLAEGRLVEQGPHADLLRGGGLYASLVRLQQGE
jgi:subfamily B ATP-binding cassette protein MsbA